MSFFSSTLKSNFFRPLLVPEIPGNQRHGRLMFTVRTFTETWHFIVSPRGWIHERHSKLHSVKQTHAAHERFLLFSCIFTSSSSNMLQLHFEEWEVSGLGVGASSVLSKADSEGELRALKLKGAWPVPFSKLKLSHMLRGEVYPDLKHILITLAKSSSIDRHRLWIGSLLISLKPRHQQSILIYLTIRRASFH